MDEVNGGGVTVEQLEAGMKRFEVMNGPACERCGGHGFVRETYLSAGFAAVLCLDCRNAWAQKMATETGLEAIAGSKAWVANGS